MIVHIEKKDKTNKKNREKENKSKEKNKKEGQKTKQKNRYVLWTYNLFKVV